MLAAISLSLFLALLSAARVSAPIAGLLDRRTATFCIPEYMASKKCSLDVICVYCSEFMSPGSLRSKRYLEPIREDAELKLLFVDWLAVQITMQFLF